MPQVNQTFQGQILILPGAYYADNVSAAQPTTPPATPPLIFIGYGYGQASGQAVTFADPNDLLTAIRGGPASGFVPFLTNPSPQLNGAQLITYINPARNTQSSLNLLGTIPPTSGVAVLTSANYGTPSNFLQASISAGSLAGKKITIFDGFAGTETIGDNLGVPFQLAYTGLATGGLSFTVATTGTTATSFSVTSPNSGESSTIQISGGQYTQVFQIVNFLNGTGFWSAVPVGDGTMPANLLDHQNGTLAASGSGLTYSNITATLGSVTYWVNQYASAYATAAVSGSVTQLVSGLAPANIPLTSFGGATSVPPTNNDYANAFNLALAQPGWSVFVDSNTAAVMALLAQHVETASEITNGAWRRGFTGSNVGDSVNATVANAQSLDSNRVAYVYPGIYRTNTQTGANQLYGGLYAAAAAAGMDTGNPPATPLTNKILNGNGLELALTVSQINTLQQGGVMPLGLQPNTNVPSVISDITTWQVDSNPENVFLQQMNCRDYLAYSLVNALQPYVGGIASTGSLTQVRNATKAALNALIYTPGSNGVINSWDPKSLVLTYTGATQTLAVQVNVTLVGQNRFITIFVPIQPLNLASAAA